MIVFDFFNDDATELVNKFCEYFKLDKQNFLDYFCTVDKDVLTPEAIVKKFELKLDDYNSNELGIICRHMTTAKADEIQNFKDKGILDLKTMLQEKTLLSDFLEKHKIQVDVDRHIIEVNGHKYPILMDGEICKECYNGRNKICKDYFKCDIFDKITNLATKLYYYDATVEFFINGTLHEMKGYSAIKRCPEILDTLDEILSAVNQEYSNQYTLCYDWVIQEKKCYVLEFCNKLSELETFRPIDYRRSYSDYENILYLCGYDFNDYMEKIVPKVIYDNTSFLKKFISIYFYNEIQYGSLLPEKCVSPEKIKIYNAEGDDLIEIK